LLRRTASLLVGIFGWGQSTQTAVWPELTVILAPGFDEVSGFGEPEEKKFVQTLVTQFVVEAFDEGVLHQLAGLDVVPGHPLGGPAQEVTEGSNPTRSATESPIIPSPRAKSRKRRVHGVICDRSSPEKTI
jgi:hypothetical protein